MPAMKQTADNDNSGGDSIAAQIEIMPTEDKETEKDLFINGKNNVVKISDQQSGMLWIWLEKCLTNLIFIYSVSVQ